MQKSFMEYAQVFTLAVDTFFHSLNFPHLILILSADSVAQKLHM